MGREMLGQVGWISIWRPIMDKSYYKNSHYVHLWFHCLMRANHVDVPKLWNGKEIIIKRGSFITSRAHLSEETGISESTIERLLKFFKNEQQIEQQGFNKYRIITIINYDKYQFPEQQNEQPMTQQAIQPADSKRHTDNNVNNDNNENKHITPRFKYEPRHLELATYLSSRVSENLPFHKQGGKDFLLSWADDIRKVEEIDSIPFDKIKFVLEWCQSDEFWKLNIRSASKFRKQFGQLEAKSRFANRVVKSKEDLARERLEEEMKHLKDYGDEEKEHD